MQPSTTTACLTDEGGRKCNKRRLAHTHKAAADHKGGECWGQAAEEAGCCPHPHANSKQPEGAVGL